jgi:Domain of unknown function (DUF6436)
MVLSVESTLSSHDRPTLRIRDWVLWLVFAAWLSGAAYAFWFFELRLQRPFVSPAHGTLFDSGSDARVAEDWFRRSFPGLAQPAAGAHATVVHVYDAQCPCNRFTDPHLATIRSVYQQRQVRFVRVERSGPIGAGAPRWIEATPAALVFDGRGKLIYFGPYSDTAACGTSNGLVERVLDQVLSGKSPRPGLVLSGGCFCATQSRKI